MFEAILIWGYLALGGWLEFLFALAWILTVVYIIFKGATYPEIHWLDTEKEREYKKLKQQEWKTELLSRKYPLIIPIVLSLLLSAYPSKEDLKWIIGGALVWNGVQAASDIEGIEQLPKNTVEAMNHFLKSIQEEDKDGK